MAALHIRPALPEEYPLVRRFYHDVIDRMQDAPYSPAWQKGIYPSDEYLSALLADGQLWLGFLADAPAAAMVFNHSCSERYASAPWQVQAAPQETGVLHLLCVHPLHARKGYAKQLVRHAVSLAQGLRCKCIRLDVLADNLPALRLYEGEGFRRIATLPLFYEDTGLTDFVLYELPL